MKYLLLAAVGSALLMPNAAFAQTETMRKMTPDALRHFILALSEKTKPGSKLSDEKIAGYLNSHLFDAGTYKSDVTFSIPGHPDQVREISLDKHDFIENVIAGRKLMRNHESSADVIDVTVESGKNLGTLSTVTRERGEMPFEGRYVPFTGETVCRQQVALDGNVPIILTATCQSQLTFSE